MTAGFKTPLTTAFGGGGLADRWRDRRSPQAIAGRPHWMALQQTQHRLAAGVFLGDKLVYGDVYNVSHCIFLLLEIFDAQGEKDGRRRREL
jgi:hypothetical protein